MCYKIIHFLTFVKDFFAEYQFFMKFLETTNKDMLEISQICGFNSSAYFSNVFKNIMKDSPSEYRQKKRKNIIS